MCKNLKLTTKKLKTKLNRKLEKIKERTRKKKGISCKKK